MTSCITLSKKPRPWTTQEKLGAVGGTILAGLNYVGTENALDDPNCVEISPIHGKRPSDSRLLIGFAVTHGLALWMADKVPTITVPVFDELEIRGNIVFGKAVFNASFWRSDKRTTIGDR